MIIILLLLLIIIIIIIIITKIIIILIIIMTYLSTPTPQSKPRKRLPNTKTWKLEVERMWASQNN